MKKIYSISIISLCVAMLFSSCDAFSTLSSTRKAAQGRAYEVVVVCPEAEWRGEVGDTIKAVFNEPVPYLNQIEPQFNIIRVNGQNFKGMVADHRNIIKVIVEKKVQSAQSGIQYDVTAQPQIVMTIQAPTDSALVDYISKNRQSILQALEGAERDRDLKQNREYGNLAVERAVRERFGVEMNIPRGYILADDKENFLWARCEYPTTSQGFFIYTRPYKGKESITPEALLAARNRFAAQIPGPSEGSYMITAPIYEPDFRAFRLEGRVWLELRGFWDVANDYMGGPFVSYTTIDTKTNTIFTFDGYVFAPNEKKRNLLRGVEHLLYSISFEQSADDAEGVDGVEDNGTEPAKE